MMISSLYHKAMEDETMNDYIKITKIWQDSELTQLKVKCSSLVASATTKIYVSDSLLDDLVYQIKQFLDGRVKESLWANEERGNNSTACVSLRFLHKDQLGHVLIEVFIELDDGGEYDNHNCCFYVRSEIGLLTNFCNGLTQLKQSPTGYEVLLNDF